MSFNIDAIRRKVILDTPETVSSNWTSDIWSLDNRFGPFSVTVRYSNGATPNMKFYLQVANTEEDVDFTDIEETEAIVNDASGVINLDINGTGMLFARIRVEVTAGTVQIDSIKFVGQQAH